tara:strand:+ start:539 stop:1123 length:585 start_codon:yes stop_codon:yes gene_type:complete
MLVYFALIFIACVIYKIARNTWFFIKLKNYQEKYNEYTAHNSRDDEKWDSLYQKVLEDKAKIIEILKELGLKDFIIQVTTPTGYNHVEHKSIRILENLQYISYVNDTNIPVTIKQYIIEAKGIAKNRIFESLNPLYWVDLLIFLPRSIAKYIGIPLANKTYNHIIKIFNIIYWIAMVLLPFIFKFLGIKLTIII